MEATQLRAIVLKTIQFAVPLSVAFGVGAARSRNLLPSVEEELSRAGYLLLCGASLMSLAPFIAWPVRTAPTLANAFYALFFALGLLTALEINVLKELGLPP